MVLEMSSGGDVGATDRIVAKILNKIQSENWGKFKAKPVLIQVLESCRTFRPGDNLQKMSMKYLVYTIRKYPALIFQKFIDGYGKSVGVSEVRTYCIGQEYQFSMVATQKKILHCLRRGKLQGRNQNGVLKLAKLANIETQQIIA